MPRLTVRGEGEEVVYDGPGELVIRDDPMAPGQVRISIHQEEVRATGVRGRELDITEFLREAPASHAAEYDVPEVAAFDLDGPALLIPFPEPSGVHRWVLEIGYPAGALAWLGETLRQSFETPDERRARLEARHESFREAMRTARQGAFGTTALMQVMQPDLARTAAAMEDLRAQAEAVSGQRITLSDLLAGGAVPREAEGGHEVAVPDYEATVRFSAQDVRSSMDRLRDQYVNRDPASYHAEIQRLYNSEITSQEQFLHGFWDTEPPPFDPSRIGAAGDFGDTFPDVLERIRARSAEHEEAITSARSEFPYDPLDYGRIYPGDTGTSRWTPPEDPDEKIRSCP